jgi:uncharacterized membrane protein
MFERHARHLLASLAAAVAVACSSSSSDAPASSSQCVVAPACPDGGVPSYASEIAPIIQDECVPCHSPNGIGGFSETTYADVYNQFGSMLSQVNACLMPPANGPPMTNAQRVALTAWLRCGAPDN